MQLEPLKQTQGKTLLSSMGSLPAPCKTHEASLSHHCVDSDCILRCILAFVSVHNQKAMGTEVEGRGAVNQVCDES